VGGDEGNFFTNKECTEILATFIGPRLSKQGSLLAINCKSPDERLASSSRVDEPMRGVDMSAICRILYVVKLSQPESNTSQRGSCLPLLRSLARRRGTTPKNKGISRNHGCIKGWQ
jgi:hypothetical protein